MKTNTTKALFASMIVAAGILSFTACGNKEAATEAPAATETAAPADSAAAAPAAEATPAAEAPATK